MSRLAQSKGLQCNSRLVVDVTIVAVDAPVWLFYWRLLPKRLLRIVKIGRIRMEFSIVVAEKAGSTLALLFEVDRNYLSEFFVKRDLNLKRRFVHLNVAQRNF